MPMNEKGKEGGKEHEKGKDHQPVQQVDRLPDSVISGIVNITETDHLGPALKSVFESGKEKETIDNLQLYVKRKQSEIEEICSANYQEFINSINELLEVRQDTRQMRETVIGINKDLQDTAQFLLEKAQALAAKRRERQRVESAIITVKGLQHVIDVCMKVDEDIKERRFYPALRLLDQIQKLHLRKGVAGDGPLFRVLDAHVPKLKTKIKKQVTEEFNDWLVLVRMKCEELGSLAMKQMEAQLAREKAMNPLRRTEHGWGIQELDTDVPVTPEISEAEEKPLFDKVDIDFSALYRCLHIHEYLTAKQEFAAYYRDNRRLQAMLVLQPVKERTLEASEPYFHQIAGFFIVENTVLETTTLVARAVVEALWDYAVAKMKAVLQEQFAYVSSPEILSKVKVFVFCFASTLKSYSYDISSLTAFLDTLKEKYTELAVDKFVADFQVMVEQDKLEPLTVEDSYEYNVLISNNRLEVPLNTKEEEEEEDKMNKSGSMGSSSSMVTSGSRKHMEESLPDFPQTYAFSIIVPKFYEHVRKFIKEFYEFANDLSDTDHYIIKSTDTLIKSLTQALVSNMEQATNVPQLVQAITNTLYILKSVNFFGDYLGRWTRAGGRVTLVGSRRQLENAISVGEKRMLELGDQKIDELMSTAANINWLPGGTNTDPRSYIFDLELYLNTTLAFTQNLNGPLREEITSRAFRRIGDAMLAMLLGPSVSFKKFNIAAVKNLDMDLAYMEKYAKSKSVELGTSKNLTLYFAELRQLLSLLLSDNMQEFLDPRVRSKNYPLVSNIPQLVALLQKFVAESHGLFAAKDAKLVQITALIKKLKELN